MVFSARNSQILQIMLESDGPIQSQEIAEKLGISIRTVQRELPFLKDMVPKYGMLLVRSRSKGNYLSGTPTARDRLLAALSQERSIDPGDKEERQRFLLFSLLKEREPRKLFYYSDQLGVSESTIAADIDVLKDWLAKNRLSVVKKRGYGVFLKGAEQDYREAMRRFIEENISYHERPGDRFDEAAFSDALLKSADSGVYSFLDKETLHRVHAVLLAMQEPKLQSLASNAYAGLVDHITIAIERIRKGGFIEVSEELLEGLEEWEEYDLAVRILGEMEEEFEILIPKEEVSYVLLHIQGSKVAYSRDVAFSDDPAMEDDKLLDLIDRMIDIYSPELAPGLKSDEEFVRGLLVHLRPVLVRMRENMNIYNPMLDEIRAEYSDIFERCAKASELIRIQSGRQVSDEEIGFLAMHFGAAEERIRERRGFSRKVSIGIVCASGFGVARLMMTRLEKYLSDKAFLKAYGRDELGTAVVKEMDFFVSTMNLDEYGVDYIRVSPLITGSDRSAIEHKLKDYSSLRRTGREEDFVHQLQRIGFITEEIRGIIESFHSYQVADNISFKELLMFLGLKATGNATLASEVSHDLMEREKLYTQLFPELSLGLLHCRTSAVSRAVFLSCTPKGGGEFADSYFKGIGSAVMLLSPLDEHRSEHAEVLGAISAAFINNQDFLKAIRSGEEEAIRRELVNEMKQFYFNYLRKISETI